jgi:hypothetical protein
MNINKPRDGLIRNPAALQTTDHNPQWVLYVTIHEAWLWYPPITESNASRL